MTFRNREAPAGCLCASSRPWEPAPDYPATPVSTIGRKVADVLADLRERRKGQPRRQVQAPRVARKRREGEMTLTEFGAHIRLGPRDLRKKLLAARLLQTEIEVLDGGRGAPEYYRRARLTARAVRDGLGRRLEPRSGAPYDVLTPMGQEWAAERLRRREEEQKPCQGHEVREEVRRRLRQGEARSEIARAMGLSKQRVHYHAKVLGVGNSRASRQKQRPSVYKEKPRFGRAVALLDDTGLVALSDTLEPRHEVKQSRRHKR